MRRKDIIIIIVSVIVVVIAVALLFQYFAPATKNSGIKYEVPHPVNPTFNQDQLKVLKNDVVDYSQNISPR